MSACINASAPTRAPDPIEVLELDAWRRAEIANLTVYTNATEAEARGVFRRMEQYLAFVGDFLGDFRLDGNVLEPYATDVFLFAEEEQLRLFRRDATIAGYVVESFPVARLASSARARSPTLLVFRHELVHVVDAGDPNRHAPRWLKEGLAVYFSTVTLRSDVLTLGKPSDWGTSGARTSVDPLPLARIFSWDGTEPIEIHKFYADAWAFVHYGLQSETLGGPNRVRAFREFAHRIVRGDPWRPAFEASFDAPLPVVEAEFHQHRSRLLEAEVNTVAHFRVPIPTDDIRFEAVPAPVIAHRLVGLASEVGDSDLDTRRRLCDFLLELNANDPEALLGRMRVATLDRDFELAEHLWGHVPPGSRDGLDALVAQAELTQARWLAQPAITREHTAFAEACAAWARVLVVAPDHLQALLELGQLYSEMIEEDPYPGIDALRRAIDLDPQRRSTRLDLARLLVRAGELDAARRELEPLTATGENPETARKARRLLGQLH